MRYLLVVLALAIAAPAQDAPARNVLVIVADDLGWKDLAVTGSPFYETPHLDALAASGVRFAQGYASCPVCSPTRAALLTGKHPARMATTDYFGGRRKGKLTPATYTDHLPLEEVTLAEALRGAGYRTAFFGKWHLGGEGFGPTDQGFEVNAGGHHRGSPPGGYFSPYKNPALTDGPEGEQLTERLTDEAVRFLQADDERPFLAYVSYYAVHTPLQAKQELVEKYANQRDALAKLTWEERWRPEGPRHARQVQDHAVYAAMVETMDACVGRLLAALDDLGVADETLVVFTSDNGGLSTSEGSPTSNAPLRAGKGWVYEGGIRVPWILRLPGVTPPGAVRDVPVVSTDLYPTVLAALGLPARPDQHVDGVDLLPALRGEALDDRPLFWHYPHYGNQGGVPSGAVRVGQWKLVEDYEDDSVALFDLTANPGETRDLSEAEPERTRALRRQLHAWRESVTARMPAVNPDYDAEKDAAFHRRADRAATAERRR